MTGKKYRKVLSVGILAIIGVVAISLSGCSSRWDREMKSTVSNWTGGLNRTVTVYDYNGQEIKSWTGKFDVTEDDNEVYFDDENDKRVIIQGGIVINEEN
ncbi:hypothetical protein DW272_02320 [Blautia obeum]|uniref:Uncharacterized protein n=1 Tax=Blautia obeum TaxID=40520 RepID=A0A414SKG5_9FIRM|nr:hypothetical protein [Blautia obeum]RHG20061.1 hypothetical protein DW272_02320 [Blautia obeum]